MSKEGLSQELQKLDAEVISINPALRTIKPELITWNNIQSFLGQLFGLIIAGGVLFASYNLALKGHEVVACVLGGTTIVSLVGIFVYGKKKQKEDF